MEKEIEEIRTKIENFMMKYSCEVEVKSVSYGFTVDGKLAEAKAKIIINS